MDFEEIINVTREWIENSSNVLVSISGGADSDVVLDIVMKAAVDLSKVHFVFFDTGIEYSATLKHLETLEDKYSITIEKIKPTHNVPYACTHVGVPFMSKLISNNIYQLQKHGFQWEDEEFDTLVSRYPGCKSPLRWWCNAWDANSRFNISRKRFLKEFLIQNKPPYNISSSCCNYAKKDTSADYSKEHGIDLIITGLRKCEGGVRAAAYNGCYSESGSVGHYRPLWFVTTPERDAYCKEHSIVHSDCYTKYGMTRTGCAGCPFDKDYFLSLRTIKKYEPQLYDTVNNIFGKSYTYTNEFLKFAYDMKKGKK